jgi:hypothetical protein
LARVLSVHNRVINLVTEDGLLALALPQAGGSSRFLCLNRLPELQSGEDLRLSPGELGAGTLSIDLGGVALWQGLLPPRAHATLTPQRFRDFAEAVAILGIQQGRFRDGFCVPRSLTPSSPVAQLAGSLLGLGPGLTPAGDDILLGYLAVNNHLGDTTCLTRELHAAVADGLKRTTMLSTQLLRNALEADYHETVQRVLAILLGLSPENLLTALRRLAAVGASSGEATIYGMWLALQRVHRENAANTRSSFRQLQSEQSRSNNCRTVMYRNGPRPATLKSATRDVAIQSFVNNSRAWR